MPRPEFTSNRTSGKKSKSGNPLTNWLKNRKEMQKQAAEQAAMEITEDTAQNEIRIIDTLLGIDFIHSKLPPEVLERKLKPEHPCGDLEYSTKAMVNMMRKYPQTANVDLREFDQRLLTLAMKYKQAIENGDERAAFAAKAALIRGMKDIRQRVPENQPELAETFVKVNSSYLDSWITLVDLAQVADRTKEDVDQYQRLYDEEQARINEANQELKKQIQSDPELVGAFREMLDRDTPEERTRWSDTQRKLHKMMIDKRIAGVNLGLKSRLLQQKQIALSTREGQVETLYTKVASLPLVTDPNLMNEFQDQIDELFTAIVKSDEEIDETLKIMDDIEGRLAQIDSAPGTIRAREVAADEAEKALEEIKKQQDEEIGLRAAKAKDTLRSLGIRSEEEQKALQKQLEEEQQQVVETIMETESEDIYNYN